MMSFVAVLPHLWILGVISIVAASAAVWLWFLYRKYRGEYDLGAWAVTVVASMLVSGTLIALLPMSPRYWNFYDIHGKVEKITNAITTDDNGYARIPVVTLEGFSLPVVVDDPRILTLKGKNVDLLCTVEWVPYGADRYNCGIRSYDQ